jgi:hypothetical protein
MQIIRYYSSPVIRNSFWALWNMWASTADDQSSNSHWLRTIQNASHVKSKMLLRGRISVIWAISPKVMRLSRPKIHASGSPIISTTSHMEPNKNSRPARSIWLLQKTGVISGKSSHEEHVDIPRLRWRTEKVEPAIERTAGNLCVVILRAGTDEIQVCWHAEALWLAFFYQFSGNWDRVLFAAWLAPAPLTICPILENWWSVRIMIGQSPGQQANGLQSHLQYEIPTIHWIAFQFSQVR